MIRQREEMEETPRNGLRGRAERVELQEVSANGRGLRRGQRGEERRTDLFHALRAAHEPVLGSDLAQQFGVSRQVLVQDMAILRAGGADVIATPRGYLLRNPEPAAHRTVIAVQLDRAAMVDELTILVDLGIRIVDVGIDHPVLGPLRAELNIASRQDVAEFDERLEETNTRPLFELTGGRHNHTVESSRPDLLERARAMLAQRGYLVS